MRKPNYLYIEEELRDPDRDLPDDRCIKLKNNILHIKKDGQYGHWFINFDKGQVPDNLKGAYTSPDYARAAAMAYLDSKGRLEEIIG